MSDNAAAGDAPGDAPPGGFGTLGRSIGGAASGGAASPECIEAVFRNGSVTVVGVVAGFSLSFLTAWAANPLPWQLHDLVGLVPLMIGIALQLAALAGLLQPSSLERPRYDRAVRLFLIGLVLVAAGVVIAIGIDAVKVAERS
jgi:hypothetical protein